MNRDTSDSRNLLKLLINCLHELHGVFLAVCTLLCVFSFPLSQAYCFASSLGLIAKVKTFILNSAPDIIKHRSQDVFPFICILAVTLQTFEFLLHFSDR